MDYSQVFGVKVILRRGRKHTHRSKLGDRELAGWLAGWRGGSLIVSERERLAELISSLKSSLPVNSDVTIALVEFFRAVYRRSRVGGAELIQTVKDRTVSVLAHVELLHAGRVRRRRRGRRDVETAY